MTVHLVTGGAGFIGSHLAKALTVRDQHVIIIDDLSGGFQSNIPDGAQFVRGDLATMDLGAVFDVWRPTYIWHCAAYAAEGLSHWVRGHNVRNNWLASTRLITAAVDYGVERFTFMSSMAVYGSQTPPFTETMRPAPEDPYGIAKYAVEQDLKAASDLFGLNYVVFRPHNVYGRNQNIGDPYRNVVGIFMRQALQGKPLTVFGDGTQTRAFSHVSDIIRPIVSSTGKPVDGSTFNIGGEQVVTIGELAEKVAGLFPGTVVEHVPERYEVKHAYCDHTLARETLGYVPLKGLDHGLADMAKWVKQTGVRTSTTPNLEHRVNLPLFWR